MKSFIISNCLSVIKNNNPNYDCEKMEKIEYGLTSIFLMIPKLIILLLVAHFINLLPEILFFLVIHSIMKSHSYGFHMKSSMWCFLISLILFLFIPVIAMSVNINIIIKAVMGLICIPMIYKNCPADTHKRPIINQAKRKKHKLLATIIAFIYFCLSFLDNNFIAKSFLFSLCIQTLATSPVLYFVLKLPHDNYLNERRCHSD